MKISELDSLHRGDIIVLSGGVSYDPNLIGYNDGNSFEFISSDITTYNTTIINLKGLSRINSLDEGYIHRFSTSIVKYMKCNRLVRDIKLEELGIC